MLRQTLLTHRRHSGHYVTYWNRAKLTDPRKTPRRAQGINPNVLRQPHVENKFRHQHYAEVMEDLRSKENLELTETIRAPQERDFYQDHTYHHQWTQRKLQDDQVAQLKEHYGWMVPGYTIEPWLWYPGDMVEFVEGEFTGQRGIILTVVKYKNQIMVQNVNVKPITIPASETRPEHTVQREHPIRADMCRIVDPSTNQPGECRLIKVRDRESGETVQQRIFLKTGVMLPIPNEEAPLESDPLHDTPLEDAEEPTYDESTEKPVMVDRKLKAMENAFVDDMRKGYEFHQPFAAKNEGSLRKYQWDVVRRAEKIAIEAFRRGEVRREAHKSDQSSQKDEEEDPELVAIANTTAKVPRAYPKDWWFEARE